MLRLVQYLDHAGHRRVAVSSEDPTTLRLVDGFERVYDLAMAAIREQRSLAAMVHTHRSDNLVDYDSIISEQRLLPPLDHPDPARCIVSLTGLTHLGSATSRDQMHAAATAGSAHRHGTHVPTRRGRAASPRTARSVHSRSGPTRATAGALSRPNSP